MRSIRVSQDAPDSVRARPDPPTARLCHCAAATHHPAVSLTLLGGFMLRVDADPVELPAGAQRLVALLALRGRTGRSRLAGMLWPETMEHRALASLRTGIWRVNQAAGQLISSTSGTVDLSAGVAVDVRRVVEHGRAMLKNVADHPVDQAHAVLDSDGELLPDWDDEWLHADRERLRQIRLHLLEASALRLAQVGLYGLALEAALAALRMDDWRESAHRALIQVHLAEGNVSEARRAYERCRVVLVHDVGVEPSPATSRLLAGSLATVPVVAGRLTT
jgi:DNA-binding SARP family transcriptional activator